MITPDKKIRIQLRWIFDYSSLPRLFGREINVEELSKSHPTLTTKIVEDDLLDISEALSNQDKLHRFMLVTYSGVENSDFKSVTNGDITDALKKLIKGDKDDQNPEVEILYNYKIFFFPLGNQGTDKNGF